MEPKRTGCFKDKECTCECGNKHELFGGVGYRTTRLEAASDGRVDGGYYIKEVVCNACGEKSELVF